MLGAAAGTGVRGVKEIVVLGFAGCAAAIETITKVAVPVVLPLKRTFLKDVMAVRAGDIVTEAEVLMEHHGAFGDPLQAVFALLVVW